MSLLVKQTIQKIGSILNKHPVTRGMLSYALIWPTGNFVQQTISGDPYDFKKCLRFGMFGCFIVAPSLFGWIRLSSAMWPATSLRTALAKAACEQVGYTPFAMTTFFFAMTLLETFDPKEAIAEVKSKVLPTFKVAICIWPILQTINFSLIPEKNRVVFVSCCSLIWTIFLAYMKQLERDRLLNLQNSNENRVHL